ncbi:MAG: metalloendopeptidase [Sandaracinus sp.]|nr:metalloendopeptidase [Sandaracinus sp.]
MFLSKEEAAAADEADLAAEAAGAPKAAPVFQLPFPCGQVWAGQTRTNHSPVNSVDFNRRDDFGDSVLAAAPGRVTVVGNTGSSSYGRWIEIDHGSGYRTRYAHLRGQAVSVGQRVRRGQRIGAVGNSGGSTGPHLHFELRRNGVAIRPSFNGNRAHFFGTRNYKSRNGCATQSDGTNGTVRTNGAPLTIRSAPRTDARAVGTVASGTRVRIRCHRRGTRVTGKFGTTRLWDRIGRGFISDAYVHTGTDGRVAPWCD